MSIDASAYIAYGLVYKMSDLTGLRDILLDEDKHILSPANLAQDDGVFAEVEYALHEVLTSSLGVMTAFDGDESSLIVYARGTEMEIDFKNRPFSAMSFRDLAKPSEEQIRALRSVWDQSVIKDENEDEFGFESDSNRLPHTPDIVLWGWIG